MNSTEEIPTTNDAPPGVAITFALWVGLIAAVVLVLILIGVDFSTAIDNAVAELPPGKIPVETSFAKFFPPLPALSVYCLVVPLAIMVAPAKFFKGSLPTVLIFSYGFYGWFASALLFITKFSGSLNYYPLQGRQILQFALTDPIVIVPALQILIALWLSSLVCKARKISIFSEEEKGRLPWMPLALVVALQVGYFLFFDFGLKYLYPNAQ